MKKIGSIIMLFIILALLQLAMPLYLAWRWEDIRQNGRPYQWQTAPVDPYDALRGRYVDLRIKQAEGPVTEGETLTSGQTVYAVIGVDDKGYAYISAVSATRPVTSDYVEARMNYMHGARANVTLPFKRYYLPEEKAPAADIAYRKSAGQDGRVTVRVKNGYGMVEQLYIGEQTLDEYLKNP